MIALPIEEGSLKVRSGPPIDDAEDLGFPVWAGVIPLRLTPDAPIAAPDLAREHSRLPAHVFRGSLPAADVHEQRRGELLLSTDRRRIDFERVFEFLAQEAYWSRGIERERLERAIRGSLCVGVYRGDEQLGFARLVTDRATFAYLGDVFVIESARGRGIASWMVGFLRSLPELSGIRRWLLATRDAHDLYARFGFRPLAHPERMLEIFTPYDAH